jgi:hypothetical protein
MPPSRIRWLRMLALAAIIPAGAWLVRPWLRSTTIDQMQRQYQSQIVALSDRDAVQLIRRLAQEDAAWLDVLVATSSDERPTVAAAAEWELRELVDRWANLPPADSSSRIAKLAAVIARQAKDISAHKRLLIHSVAHRLIDWPIDGQQIDAARFIANCQTVLLLPVAEPPEIRVAATMARVELPSPQPPPSPATPIVPSAPPPMITPAPAPIIAQQPMPLPQANHETPIEPKQFLPPRAMRISDE